MLPFLLKRLLLTLPALFILATFVFLLSRLLPGASGAEKILQENGAFYSTGSVEGRQEAYRTYLKRTGQDLPLFYFSLKASTQPDTLDLIYPESERILLQRLSWHFGNWPAVAAYYKSLKQVERVLLNEPVAKAKLEHLFKSTSPESVTESLQELANSTDNAGAEIQELKIAAANLLSQQQSFTFLLPSFRWHGSQNQYHNWVTSLLSGNTGTSFRDMRPVHELLFEAISNTFWLILVSIVVAFAISLELGILLVMRKGKALRKLFLPALFALDSIPLFLLALLLLVLFASPGFLQWFPVFGMGLSVIPSDISWMAQLSVYLQYMALPTISLILINIPYLTNLIYRTLLEEKTADYARTARAKGLSENQVIRRHVLRNSLLPFITIFSEALPALIAGTVVVETIFAIPGMGRLLVSAVATRDYPVIVGIVLLVAVFRVLFYLLADLSYSLADPRIRHPKV